MLLFVDFKFALSGEWMSEVAGVAATFVIFVMGIPALISQTFIPDSLRSLCKEYLDGRWPAIFYIQVIIILMLLVLSMPGVSSFAEGQRLLEWGGAIFFYGLALFVFITGTCQLIKIFKATKNPGQALTEKIVENTLKKFDPKTSLDLKKP